MARQMTFTYAAPTPIMPNVGDKYITVVNGRFVHYTVTTTGEGETAITLRNDATGTSWTTSPAGFAVHVRGGLTRAR